MNPIHASTEAPLPPPSPRRESLVQHSHEQIPLSNTPRHLPAISPTSAPVQIHHSDDEAPRLPPPTTPGSSTSNVIYSSSFTPIRKDTGSSVSTQGTLGSADISTPSYSAETSPNLHHSIFSAKDGSDVSNNRRASRRRTGPLSQLSRERAALIRKLGACPECRRRRVACHPSHHGMTWENLVHKFSRGHSPSMSDIAPNTSAGRQLSPSSSQMDSHPIYSHHDTHEMDIDPQSASHHGSQRIPHSDARLRTPLPAGPRLEKSLSLPGIESLKSELQANVSKIVSSSNRGRYSEVRVMMFMWSGDDEAGAGFGALRELADVLEKQYRFTVHIESIPITEPGPSKTAWKWVSQLLDSFLDSQDHRDVLKVVFYAGHTILDGNREFNLASSRDVSRSSLVRWSAIQQRLEHAISDAFVIMDAAFYPCTPIVRRHGVLEVIAASLSEDHLNSLGRFNFTRLLTEQFHIRAARSSPFSVAELHSTLLTTYPKVVRERNPEAEQITSYPAPFHMLTSGNSRLPSIFLSPIQLPSPLRPGFAYENNPQLHLTIKLVDESVDLDSWNEWLRLIPDGAKDVKIEGPFRASFS